MIHLPVADDEILAEKGPAFWASWLNRIFSHPRNLLLPSSEIHEIPPSSEYQNHHHLGIFPAKSASIFDFPAATGDFPALLCSWTGSAKEPQADPHALENVSPTAR